MKELIKKTLLWTLFGMLILMIPLVFGYNINNEINLNIPVQYDNGTHAVFTSSALCYASIIKDNNYITRNALMDNLTSYYSYSFTPNETGTYHFNMECYYNNETQFYYEQFNVIEPIVVDSSSYSYEKNIEIDLKTTELNQEQTSFKIFYTIDNEPKNVANAFARILQDNEEIEYVDLKELSVGIYQFDGDFSEYKQGNYEIEVNMNDYKEIIEINIKSDNLITGFIIDKETQSLNIRNIIIGIVVLILLGTIAVLLITKRSKNE